MIFIFFLYKKIVGIEGRYLIPILPGLFNQVFRFSKKFFSTLGTNLLVNSNAISHMLAHLAPILKEKM